MCSPITPATANRCVVAGSKSGRVAKIRIPKNIVKGKSANTLKNICLRLNFHIGFIQVEVSLLLLLKFRTLPSDQELILKKNTSTFKNSK